MFDTEADESDDEKAETDGEEDGVSNGAHVIQGISDITFVDLRMGSGNAQGDDAREDQGIRDDAKEPSHLVEIREIATVTTAIVGDARDRGGRGKIRATSKEDGQSNQQEDTTDRSEGDGGCHQGLISLVQIIARWVPITLAKEGIDGRRNGPHRQSKQDHISSKKQKNNHRHLGSHGSASTT